MGININLSSKPSAGALENYLENQQNEIRKMGAELDVQAEQTIQSVGMGSLDLKSKINQLQLVAETICLSYNERKEKVALYAKLSSNDSGTTYYDMSPEDYVDLCKEYCDPEDKFNNSNTYINTNGDMVRVFSVNAPVSRHPSLTMSVSRYPDLTGYQFQPEVMPYLEELMTHTTLFFGCSGSGKTYFLNRALRYVYSDDVNLPMKGKYGSKRLTIIEEFRELWEPNKNTICLSSCAAKPDTPYNVYRFEIQQLNLMRTDFVLAGEIKGAEAFDFILNLSSGNKGITTCHGQTVENGLARVQLLMTMAGVCDSDQCGDLLAQSVDYVVHMANHKIDDIKRLTHVYNHTSHKFQMENLL